MTELTNANINSVPAEKRAENRKNYPVISPRVDITETESTVYLMAEMPGVSEKNVDVDLQGNTLTLHGITDFTPPDGYSLTCGEYTPNRTYERQFTLGDAIDLNAIDANMKDGVLKLTLPKIKEPAPRKIIVKTC